MKTYFPIFKYFVIGLEVFFLANIICLWNLGHSLRIEKTLYQVILFLMIQNGIVFVLVGATCFVIWKKNTKIKKTSPFYSFIITTNKGKLIREVFLDDKKSFCLVRKKGKEIEWKESNQSDLDDIVCATFNLFEENWYIETMSERYPVGIRRGEETVIYRLKNEIPYRLCPSDIIYMGTNKILIKELDSLEE